MLKVLSQSPSEEGKSLMSILANKHVISILAFIYFGRQEWPKLSETDL